MLTTQSLFCRLNAVCAPSTPPFFPIARQGLLSERVTDCRVHDFSRGRAEDNADGADHSHLNYQKSAATIAGARERLEADEAGDDDDAEEARRRNDLRNEATLSLARILAKQGSVAAMLGHHRRALVRSRRASRPRVVVGVAAVSHASIFPRVAVFDTGLVSGFHHGLQRSRRPG